MNRFKLTVVLALGALLATTAADIRPAEACGVKLVVKSNRRPGQRVATATNRAPVQRKAVDDRTQVGGKQDRVPVAVGPERPPEGTKPIVATAEPKPSAEPAPRPVERVETTATARVETPKPAEKPVEAAKPVEQTKVVKADPRPKAEKAVAVKGPPISLELYFDLGAREVSGDSASAVAQVKEYLDQNPGARLVIEGHTDPSGSAGFNQRLSVSRANTVRAMLIEQTGAKGSTFTVKGYGESKLAYDADDARNRRVVIRNR